MSKSALLAILTLCLLVSSCGIKIDDNYTGLGKEALPGDPLNPKEESQACVCNPTCECNCTGAVVPLEDLGDLPGPDDLTGNAWRFTSLTIRDSLLLPETGDDTTAQMLNAFIGPEIEAGNINVIMLADVDDREAGTVAIRIGGGGADGEGYKYPEEPAKMLLDLYGVEFSTLESDRLKFPVDNLTPPYLPMSELELSGTFSADGTGISNGLLIGFLTVEDAKTVEILYSTLEDALKGAGIPPDTDLDDNGKMDAWRILADFTVLKVAFVGE